MTAKEFLEKKIGEKNYTHHPIREYRSNIANWMEQYANQEARARYEKAIELLNELLIPSIRFRSELRKIIKIASGLTTKEE